jgi:hypothetical protein
LRIPYFGAAKRFTPTVVFATHRRCRDSDSIALRTAGSELQILTSAANYVAPG